MPEDMSHYGTVTFALTLVISWDPENGSFVPEVASLWILK